MTQQEEQNRATWNGKQWKTPAMQQSLAMQQAMKRVRELTELDGKGKVSQGRYINQPGESDV